jgi:tetratricopeptide (TPR) repeat protein
MKKILLILIAFQLSLLTSIAQPSWVKKATKSVFTLKTFATDGSLIASSNGFFIGTNGEAVSSFSPFKGASRAVIIDAQGKETEVVSILGANDIYDVVRFRVANNKTQPLPICSTTMPEGSLVWLLPYHETKQLYSGPIRKAEQFMKDYAYYTVALTSPQHTESCPLLNEEGEVIGLIQPSANAQDSLSYAISVVFADSLHMTGFSMNEPVYQQTLIKKELPDDLKEANVAIFLASSRNDSVAYAQLVDDMINKFPTAPDGYTYKAQLAASHGDYATADQNMTEAIRTSSPKDEAHFNFARLIYNKEVYLPGDVYESWNLDKALSEIQEAISINPLPSYQQLLANILFAQKKYEEAYDLYMQLTDSPLRSAEIFFGAAKCKAQLRDTTAMLSLLDSCVNMFSKPYLKEAAPFLWERAEARRNAGKYRDAVSDMNEYGNLMSASINDNFYYIRHQTEIQARLYQQALNDISQAIQMNPQETLYYAEKASLEVRVGLFDEAEATAKECISIDSNNSDGYLFLGLAQCMKGNKESGLDNLRKAKELGDPQADGLIEKYK